MKIKGIHHVTAIVGHPQENVDFYEGVLGLRLVKKTVNFDDPGTYHLYFGTEGGIPGSIITFFPWAGAQQGQIGDGQVGITGYAIPVGAYDFWKNRLTRLNISFNEEERFGEKYITFEDTHGLKIELVEREKGEANPFTHDDITPEVAIKGFAGAVLYSSNVAETEKVLVDEFGLTKVDEDDTYFRYEAEGDIGNVIDIKKVSSGKRGTMGVGTVHHIAWRTKDDEEQLAWRKQLNEHGYFVTDVKDRNYFNAIYFREPGEILFEIATDPPGFAHDESYETMGEGLMLPSQYEQYRAQLEERLIPIHSVRKQ
ncbi:ring-cleaving dioxygenase [Macrococcoides canis]|uniref:Ring-cleaving dioxygenase n=1 Tax=Macrococcoides canis TaxID=1855823 RepID=A0A6G7EUY0_9STAP|nr:ring-cleaving dioxygenase [Macrococcus canis]QCT73785.1 ring-cleaving dioxygenase [Macrococcus canis]QIH77198.1 ring-cleaving dioxygenase [Macrococcus canis]QNR06814.1 ring-cleaving dioxygenase [Macrococcus canis]QTQ08215.1 ring-cleaving dioxygenase [Macrococcus canis]QUR94529.1 ring-cleaving dioxygenase [Macrococcus canis]